MNLDNLIQNKLLLQYLAAAGSDIAAGRPIGENVNLVTQQNISAQNFMNLLSKMLSGEVPRGGKITMDDKGMKLQIPNLSKTPTSQELAIAGSKLPGGSGIDWTNPSNLGRLGALLNPSASPAISGAELAGLTPETISQALSGALNAKALEQKKLRDIADAMYKEKLMEYYDTLIGEKTPSVTLPGTNIKLTRKEFLDWYEQATKDERTAAIKNYEYAVERGYKGSFTDFLDAAKTAHQKDYERAKSEGYEGTFHEWMLEMSRAGALDLPEFIKRREATEDVKSKKYFSSPKGLAKDVERYIESDDVQNRLIRYANDPRKLKIETARAIENFIRNRIAAAEGMIEKEWVENGDTFVFKVRWKDGTTSEVRHVIR